MDEEELKEKKRVAEAWLKANPNHPKYDEALKRYEKIENELYALGGEWLEK